MKTLVLFYPGCIEFEVMLGNEQLNSVIQQLNKNRAVLGAICAGPVILDQAGVLKDRKIAHGYKGPQLQWLHEQGFFKHTHLTDEAVIVEDNIVTARPDSYIDFAVEVASLSGAIDRSKAGFWKEYYKGRPNAVGILPTT